MANYGTSPGAVLVPGMNSFVTNTVNVQSNSANLATDAHLTALGTGALATDAHLTALGTTALATDAHLTALGTTSLATDAHLTAFTSASHTDLGTINTTLGSPFQAGGNIANTGFNALVGGAALSSANPLVTRIVDAASNAATVTAGGNLNIQCANCSGSGVSTADLAAFASGSSLFAGTGGFYQTTPTTGPLTNGKQGMAQMTAYRAIMSDWYDATGAEKGVAANPVQVSLQNTGANGTPVVISGVVTGAAAAALALDSHLTALGTTALATDAHLTALGTSALATDAHLTAFTSANHTDTTAITTALGTPMQMTGGSVTANAGTNLNTSLLATDAHLTAFTSANHTDTTAIVTALGAAPMQMTGGAVTANAGTNLNTSLLATQATLVETHGVIGNATAPTKMEVTGGVYNLTALTLTNGQSASLQLDPAGRLITNCGLGCSGAAAVDEAAYAYGSPSTYTPVGGTYHATIAPLSDGQGGVAALSTNRSLHVIDDNSAALLAAASNGTILAGNALSGQSVLNLGLNVGGTARQWTGSNPSGSIYAAQVDLVAANGAALDTGAGVTDSGSLRFTAAQDQTTVAGAHPFSGATAAAVPGYASYVGLKVGSNLVGQGGVVVGSGGAQTGNTTALTDLTSTAGTAIATGAGASGAGSIRVTVAQDGASNTIAGAPVSTNLNVICTSGCATSGGTLGNNVGNVVVVSTGLNGINSYNFGFDGTYWQRLTVDANQNLRIVNYQGASALSATNGMYTNVLQGNAALSAANPSFTALSIAGAVNAVENPIFVSPGTGATWAINQTQVGGTTLLVNTGATGAGSPRVTVAVDSATLAGSVLGLTSGSPLFVQNTAGSAIMGKVDLLGNAGVSLDAANGTGTTNSLSIQGGAAAGATATENPLNNGGTALVSNPSPVTNGQKVAQALDKYGKTITSPYAPVDLWWRGQGTGSSGTVTVTGSQGTSGLKSYITDLTCWRTDTGASLTTIALNDSDSTIIPLPPFGGYTHAQTTPLVGASAATAITFAITGTISSIGCHAEGFWAP
jgi:hypothetical protein